MSQPSVEDIRRFWARVERGDGCWTWQGPRSSRANWGPYGVFNWKRDGKQRQERAHRFMWLVTYSELPKGLHVCHHCDNPLCVRPEHLFLGTDADNMADKCAKGRQSCGTQFKASVRRKLTEADVRRIIALCRAGKGHREVAERFSVTRATVTYIMLGKTWKHVDRNGAVLSVVNGG